MSRRRQALLFVLVVLGQLLALGAIVAKRELLLRRGDIVRLRCRPLDPRSLLSGDYVELTYQISALRGEELRRLNPGGERFERGDTVFMALQPDEKGEGRPVAIAHDRRSLRGRGVLLRGTVRGAWGDLLELRYGVENYFVPQREGEGLEQRLRDTVVEVAVSRSSGESAIRRLLVAGQEVRFY